MSTSIRCLAEPSLRAMWSSTTTFSICCHRQSANIAARFSTTHLTPPRSTHRPPPTRHLTTSHYSLAASPTPTSAAASSEDPAAVVYRSIHAKLTDTLQPTYLHLEDTSGGCGTFFRLLIASPHFTGQPLVKQHRLVKEAIRGEIGGIHGLTIDTMTDEQYAERKKAADERKRAGLPT